MYLAAVCVAAIFEVGQPLIIFRNALRITDCQLTLLLQMYSKDVLPNCLCLFGQYSEMCQTIACDTPLL